MVKAKIKTEKVNGEVIFTVLGYSKVSEKEIAKMESSKLRVEKFVKELLRVDVNILHKTFDM